ncbi:transglutaminase domain-containing protein [Candidatus Woesearchaeota archaeon]|nr:transglutaminase domain-containing protein [Candidatus Woesearchaeota archaeon]
MILPTVLPEFNTYQSLALKTYLSGDINILTTGSSPYMEYLKADLLLFPKENFQQQVIKQTLTTDPGYDSSSINEDTIQIKWYALQDKKLNFKVDTELENTNDFVKIIKTVQFPLSSVDGSLKKYTETTDKIDINPDIQDKANELVSGETDLYITAYKVGSWVKDNIKYDLNTLTENADQKASWVFTNKRGVCDEITNLFISMLRSVNIPSRFVSGIVYSNLDNSFGNHGWAEVYFPGYGWVPFDVTFGQYGWVDPTHIKMDDSQDSGIASVEYNWKARGLEVKATPLDFKTEVIERKGKPVDYFKISVKPVKERVSFGSYMPVEVNVENINAFYTPLTFSFLKSPEIVNGENVFHSILKPYEKKRIYTIIHIPSDLEPDYIYTSEIEIRTFSGQKAYGSMKYAKNFDYYTKDWAETLVKQLSEREKKFFFSNLLLKCTPDKELYYSTEEANIECAVINTGNVQLDGVEVCMAEDCNKVSIGIGETKSLNFIKHLTSTEKVTIAAENKEMVRYTELDLKVVEIPDLQITGLKPDSIGYYESDDLVLNLATESPAFNVKVEIKYLGEAKFDNVTDKSVLRIPFEGKDFYDGFVKVKMTYEDASKKEYTKERNLPLNVTDIPAHVRAWVWIKRMF